MKIDSWTADNWTVTNLTELKALKTANGVTILKQKISATAKKTQQK